MDNGIKAIEPNLTHINADDVWAMGITARGWWLPILIPACAFRTRRLSLQYRGNLGGSFNHNYNWFNPDDHSDNVPRGGNGLAPIPWAPWLAMMAQTRLASRPAQSGLLVLFAGRTAVRIPLCGRGQFIAAPTDLNGANANPDKRPNAVNNSWGDCSQSYDNWFEGVISAWHAGGVYPIFSNGNSSNCGYSSPPG